METDFPGRMRHPAPITRVNVYLRSLHVFYEMGLDWPLHSKCASFDLGRSEIIGRGRGFRFLGTIMILMSIFYIP